MRKVNGEWTGPLAGCHLTRTLQGPAEEAQGLSRVSSATGFERTDETVYLELGAGIECHRLICYMRVKFEAS